MGAVSIVIRAGCGVVELCEGPGLDQGAAEGYALIGQVRRSGASAPGAGDPRRDSVQSFMCHPGARHSKF